MCFDRLVLVPAFLKLKIEFEREVENEGEEKPVDLCLLFENVLYTHTEA